MSKYVHALLAICLLAVSSARSADSTAPDAPTMPTELDLPTALLLADQYNPQLRQVRERINESKSALKVTRSNMLPDVNATGLYQRDDSDAIGSFGGPEPDDYYWRAGVDLRQPLYSGGKLRAATQVREYELQSVEMDIKAAQASAYTAIHRKFYDALLAREAWNVQKESLEVITRQYQIASNRFAAGAGAKFDVLQAEVRVANARPPLIRAASNYKTAIDDLRTSLGLAYAPGMGPTNITLKGEWVEMDLTETLDEAIAYAVENRPELLSSRKLREAAAANVRKFQEERYPRVDLYAGYGIENDRFDPANDTLEGWQVGVQASISLWGGGEISGEIGRAQSQLLQLESRIEEQKLGIELEVRNAWNDAEESREILGATELVIKQAEEALRLAQNRYSAGSLTQLDVLTSELEFTRARLEQITAARNFNLAVIEFYRAIGNIPGEQYTGESP